MENRIQTVCLLFISIVLAGAALYWLQSVMIPFVLAVFLSLGLSPIIDLQVRYMRIPRVLALLSTLVMGGLLLALVGALVSASVSQLSDNAGIYEAQFSQLIDKASRLLPVELSRQFTGGIESLSKLPISSLGGFLAQTTNTILATLSKSALVLLFVIFLLVGDKHGKSEGMRGRIEAQIQRYLYIKLVISAATGILVGLTLGLLGVPLALVFGLFTFLLNFIPNIGAAVAVLLPLPVVLVSPDISSTVAVLAIAIPALIQLAVGNMVEPRVFGESMDLQPVGILLSLMFWGMLWGVVGALLAVPITASLKILFQRLEITQPLTGALAARGDAGG